LHRKRDATSARRRDFIHKVDPGLRVEVVGGGGDRGYGIMDGVMRSAPAPRSSIDFVDQVVVHQDEDFVHQDEIVKFKMWP